MKEKIEYSTCPLSIEELEQYRDEEGFIHLDDVGIEIVNGSRSQIRK